MEKLKWENVLILRNLLNYYSIFHSKLGEKYSDWFNFYNWNVSLIDWEIILLITQH